jgi:hypothetical protein
MPAMAVSAGDQGSRDRVRRPPLLDDVWRREMPYRREGVRNSEPSEPWRGLRGEGLTDADVVVERSLQDEHSLTVPRQFDGGGRTRGTTTEHGDVVSSLGVGHGRNADAAPTRASRRPRKLRALAVTTASLTRSIRGREVGPTAWSRREYALFP